MLIGGIEINSKLALAPMAGVTDAAFRITCRNFGAGLTYTEMVSAKALCFQDGKTRTLLKLEDEEHPSAVQIFGSDPVCMAEASHMAVEISGAEIIDINMGCPVGKVVKSGDGSSLMRTPELAMKIIEDVIRCGKRPVTIKIRKGWDKGSVNAVEFSKMAESVGVSAIAVHGRTRTQMYSGVADWNIIKSVKESVNIPVLANGDVFSGEDARRILKVTGADMVMIGRGSFGNPWIFRDAAAAIRGCEIPPPCSFNERMDIALRHFEMAVSFKGERLACLEARRHLAWYLKGIPHSGFYKDKITKVVSAKEVRSIIADMVYDLK